MDMAILQWIQTHCHNTYNDFIFPLISYLGNYGMIWIIIAIVMLLFKKYRYYGLLLGTALLLTFLIGELVLKPLIMRPRPFSAFPDIQLLIPKPHSYSFPSGHTASSFAAVVALWYTDRKFGIAAVILAVLIAFSRMFLFVHYPTDILGGMVLGITISSILCLIFHRLIKPKLSA